MVSSIDVGDDVLALDTRATPKAVNHRSPKARRGRLLRYATAVF
jgi:hypothetical protein